MLTPAPLKTLEAQVSKESPTSRSALTPTPTPKAVPPPPPPQKRSVDPTKPSAGFRPLSALRGEVDQVALSSVLTLLEMERKTGLLLVESDSRFARLTLRKGRIIRAATETPRLNGAPAVYEVLTWSKGGFDFLAGDAGGGDEIQTTTTFLLMEGARRADEARERERQAANDNRLSSPEQRKL
jgi:hypothetical protein